MYSYFFAILHLRECEPADFVKYTSYNTIQNFNDVVEDFLIFENIDHAQTVQNRLIAFNLL